MSAAFDVPLEDLTRRPGVVRARTISTKRLSKRELERGRAEYSERWRRPRTWGECLKAGRGTPQKPCGYVSCKHNLYLDVDPDTGSIKLAHPDLDPDEMRQTCALRVADEGGVTLDAVADVLGVVRERVRQIERDALAVARIVASSDELEEYARGDDRHSGLDLWGER